MSLKKSIANAARVALAVSGLAMAMYSPATIASDVTWGAKATAAAAPSDVIWSVRDFTWGVHDFDWGVRDFIWSVREFDCAARPR